MSTGISITPQLIVAVILIIGAFFLRYLNSIDVATMNGLPKGQCSVRERKTREYEDLRSSMNTIRFDCKSDEGVLGVAEAKIYKGFYGAHCSLDWFATVPTGRGLGVVALPYVVKEAIDLGCYSLRGLAVPEAGGFWEKMIQDSPTDEQNTWVIALR